VSVDVEKVAAPPLSVAVPRVLLPSLNVIVPVGVPLALTGVTLAVRATVWPKVEVVGFTERAVWVDGPLITTVTEFELLELKVVLP
jgi:hypothetical protein